MKDQKTLQGLVNGNQTVLTQSTTARVKDAVEVSLLNGKPTGKSFQAKSLVNESSIREAAKRINKGDYPNTKIIAPKDTAEKLRARLNNPNRLESSSYSTDYTNSLANRAGIGEASLGTKMLGSAKSGAEQGAKWAIAVAAIDNAIDLLEGKKDLAESAVDISICAVKGAATGAVIDSGMVLAAETLVSAGYKQAAALIPGIGQAVVVVLIVNSIVPDEVKQACVGLVIDGVEAAGSSLDKSICATGKKIEKVGDALVGGRFVDAAEEILVPAPLKGPVKDVKQAASELKDIGVSVVDDAVCATGRVVEKGLSSAGNKIDKTVTNILSGNVGGEIGGRIRASMGGCFITTATCMALGKGDTCTELNVFRDFRDNWLLQQSDGIKLVKDYYRIAPKIVNCIDLKGDPEIYFSIWGKHLSKCLDYIYKNHFQDAKDTYILMVRELQVKFQVS